jgi:RNA polymerase sigma-70 factor (ECF subfamily)
MTPEPIPLRTPRVRTEHVELDAVFHRVARGDEDAFAVVYDQLSSILFGIARRVIRDPARAEEVTQDVLVEIWQQAPRFDPSKGSVRTWACMIAHRRAVDAVRREETVRRTERRESHRSARREFDEVSEAVADRMEYARVRKCLDTLTELQAEAVGLAYFRGLSYPEVASMLDVKLATIKTRMRDGLIRLRDCLGATA